MSVYVGFSLIFIICEPERPLWDVFVFVVFFFSAIFSYHKLFQICMTFFISRNSKYDILNKDYLSKFYVISVLLVQIVMFKFKVLLAIPLYFFLKCIELSEWKLYQHQIINAWNWAN